MTSLSIRSVAVVGAGLMGHGIAQVFAQAGYPVALYDKDPAALERALAGIRANLRLLEEHGLSTPTAAEQTLARLTLAHDLAPAVAGVDLVVEAVYEDLAVKQEVFHTLDRLCPPTTILASNTSGLSATALAQATSRPDRVLVTHFWNPPHLIPLVEVVRAPTTSEATVQTVVALLRAVGKVPVVVQKDIPGFVGNRLQYALFREAVALVQAGVVSPEDVDTVVRLSLGRRYGVIGPLETADLNGVDLFARIAHYLYPTLDCAQDTQPYHQRLVAEGRLGVRVGRGFYDWTPERAQARIRERDAELLRWLRRDRGLDGERAI